MASLNSTIKSTFFTAILIAACSFEIPAKAQQNMADPVSIVFKTIDTVKLSLRVYHPEHFNWQQTYPVIVFFFGGGWNKRNADQFIPQARYFTNKGMVAILADYRVFNINKTTPFEAVRDAKSAIRYIKVNHARLGIDTNRLVASGGSAGGHLAAACDLTRLDEAGEDLTISSKPKALVLFNPVVNNGKGGYAYSKFKERYAEISPYHNIVKGAAPTIIFSGTADSVARPAMLQQYQNQMQKFGNRCDLYLYEGKVHGFYLYGPAGDNQVFEDTMDKATKFLISLGIISNPNPAE